MNTNTVNIMIIAFMLLMATTGCDKTTETRSKIDSEIAITMMESSSQALQLYFSTMKAYPCYNFKIDVSLKKSSNSIDIRFKGIIETGLCLDAIGPATATTDLGILKCGVYQLNFYNEHIKQSGELIVSSDDYRINLIDNSIVHFTNVPLNKIPENTIWIALNYNDDNILSSFIEDLINLEVAEKSYSCGYYCFQNKLYPRLYSGFKVEEKGNIRFYPDITNHDAMMGRLFTRSFVFLYSGNTASIEQLIKQYKEQIEIRAYTDRGEQFSSWMY